MKDTHEQSSGRFRHGFTSSNQRATFAPLFVVEELLRRKLDQGSERVDPFRRREEPVTDFFSSREFPVAA